MKKRESINEFEQAGAEWYIDRYESVKVARNRYFFLLLVCLVALICSALASLMLFPLKTAVPYVIQIDKTNGATTILKPAGKKIIIEDQAVTVYFLYQYLNARMNYDYALRQVNANLVRALSSNDVYQQYVRAIDANNPQSPIKKYRDTAKITTKIISHAFPYPNIAQVRFYTELSTNSTVSSVVKQSYLATIRYTYANIALPVSDRENLNPLGFFVTNFQLNEEAPQAER